MLVNLYKGWKVLKFPDLVVAAIIIDSTSAATSMALSGKQSLTSRLFVVIYSGLQLLALIPVGMAVFRTSALDLPNTSCQAQVYWWGTLEAGLKVPASFWLYFGLRFVSYTHRAWLAIHFTTLFDLIEKVDRGQHREMRNPPHQLELREVNPHTLHSAESGRMTSVAEVRSIAKTSYGAITATAFSLYSEYVPMMASCATAVENFLRRMRLVRVGRIQEWGQSAALITCIAAGIHVIYTYSMMWSEDAVNTRNRTRADQGLAL